MKVVIINPPKFMAPIMRERYLKLRKLITNIKSYDNYLIIIAFCLFLYTMTAFYHYKDFRLSL